MDVKQGQGCRVVDYLTSPPKLYCMADLVVSEIRLAKDQENDDIPQHLQVPVHPVVSRGGSQNGDPQSILQTL